MIYMLEFLGLLAIAAILAASPFLISLVESIFGAYGGHARSTSSYGLSGTMSNERTEMRNEIRRMTRILEADSRNTRRITPRSSNP